MNSEYQTPHPDPLIGTVGSVALKQLTIRISNCCSCITVSIFLFSFLNDRSIAGVLVSYQHFSTYELSMTPRTAEPVQTICSFI